MQEAKFIVTKELGKLAKWLRILGYDAIYYDKKETAGLIIQALRDKRVILTRSTAPAKYKGIHVVIIRSDHVEKQIEQVFTELKLLLREEGLFRRCVECNTLLKDVEKGQIKEKVPEYVFRNHEVFKKCAKCQKIFWKGTHWGMVGKWLEGKGIKGK